ncbi:MAG: cytochrome P460 family protein [Gaiellaceae bacterium]
MTARSPAVLLTAFLLAGCGGSAPAEPVAAPTASSPPPETTTAPPPVVTTTEVKTEAIPGIPRYVWPYRSWTKLNVKPVPPRDSDPHLGTKQVYASRQAAGGTFPHGSIVVKDAVRPGKDFIGLLAVMRKERGADPTHNDWVFVEYTREAKGARFTEIASGAVCWSCHMGASEADYVWIEKLGLTR